MTDYELIFFAAVAIFFAYKLWSVLGKTNGQEQARAAEAGAGSDKQRAVSGQSAKILDLKPEKIEPQEIIPPALEEGVKKIKQADKNFTLKIFRQLAEDVFEQVIKNFSAKNTGELKKLLSADVYKIFEDELKNFEAQGQQYSATLISMHKPELLDAEVSGDIAHIVAKFYSEQVHLLKNQEGKIIEGAAHEPDHISEIWTFERDFAAKKSGWIVAGIQEA